MNPKLKYTKEYCENHSKHVVQDNGGAIMVGAAVLPKDSILNVGLIGSTNVRVALKVSEGGYNINIECDTVEQQLVYFYFIYHALNKKEDEETN